MLLSLCFPHSECYSPFSSFTTKRDTRTREVPPKVPKEEQHAKTEKHEHPERSMGNYEPRPEDGNGARAPSDRGRLPPAAQPAAQPRHITRNPGLVLGWIEADFCDQGLILQHFSRSTRKSSSRDQILQNFGKFLQNFSKILAKFWQNLQKFEKF